MTDMKPETLETKRYNAAFTKMSKAVADFVATARKCGARVKSVSWRTYPDVGWRRGDSKLSVRCFRDKA